MERTGLNRVEKCWYLGSEVAGGGNLDVETTECRLDGKKLEKDVRCLV